MVDVEQLHRRPVKVMSRFSVTWSCSSAAVRSSGERTCGSAPRSAPRTLRWELLGSGEQPAAAPPGGSDAGEVGGPTVIHVHCTSAACVCVYLQQVKLPQSCVLSVTVLRFIQLRQVETAALNFLIQQEVTLGEGLRQERESAMAAQGGWIARSPTHSHEGGVGWCSGSPSWHWAACAD